MHYEASDLAISGSCLRSPLNQSPTKRPTWMIRHDAVDWAMSTRTVQWRVLARLCCCAGSGACKRDCNKQHERLSVHPCATPSGQVRAPSQRPPPDWPECNRTHANTHAHAHAHACTHTRMHARPQACTHTGFLGPHAGLPKAPEQPQLLVDKECSLDRQSRHPRSARADRCVGLHPLSTRGRWWLVSRWARWGRRRSSRRGCLRSRWPRPQSPSAAGRRSSASTSRRGGTARPWASQCPGRP